ncbi:MAG: response regulator transcription factor [Spirochaetia bacterium]
MKVFVVEDNELIREAVQEYFEVSGYEVAAFETLSQTRDALAHQTPDVIILDVMLPDGNGFRFAKEIRQSKDVPILFLTAKEQESDRIMGFEVGGDDYVVKPFSNKELLLRVKALLRRTSNDGDGEEKSDTREWSVDTEHLLIDMRSRKVFLNSQELHLTSTEWKLLVFLAERPEQAVSRDTLLGECLGYLYSGSERTVDTHIANLRNQLGKGEWIETIRGFGYRFAGSPRLQEPEQ